VRTGARVTAIDKVPGGFRVHAADGEPLDVSSIVVATPAATAATLLAPLDAELGRLSRVIASPPVVVGYAGFATGEVPAEVLDGFGVLVARGEAARVLGIVFESVVWPDRAPAGHVLFRMIYGGGRDPGIAAEGDEALRAQAEEDLAHVLGIGVKPRFFHLVRHAVGIPQYAPGHAARAAEAAARARALGVELAGNAWRAVAVNDLVREADAIAARVGARP
jgi:oxygen-dependent protoporphyrinogen oxidase